MVTPQDLGPLDIAEGSRLGLAKLIEMFGNEKFLDQQKKDLGLAAQIESIPDAYKHFTERNPLGVKKGFHDQYESMMQAIGLSKAPVIASHSAVRSLANHSRNLDDEMLMAIKTNGGVAQIVAFASYVKVDPAERGAAIAALRQEFALPGGRGGLGAGRGAAPQHRPQILSAWASDSLPKTHQKLTTKSKRAGGDVECYRSFTTIF